MTDRNTTKTKSHWWPPKDTPMFLATVAAFLAVCVYSAFTYYQVAESRKANDIAERAFFTANRPYVMWTGYAALRVQDPSKPKSWRISPVIKNFGKTPATSVVMTICDPVTRPNGNPPVLTCKIA